MRPGTLFQSTFALTLTLFAACGDDQGDSATGTTDASASGSTTDPTGGQIAPLTVEAHFAPSEAAAVASYLVHGETEAILVDGQFMSAEAAKVVDLVKASGKTLKLIWLTHAHPDHYFGLTVLRAAFPDVPIYVTPAVKADYDAIAQGTFDYLKPLLGDAIPDALVVPEVYDQPTITVDGATLEIVEVTMGEHPVASALHLPAEGAFIGGDMLYDRTHLWLTECDPDGWLAQIDQWETELAGITTFYPGHGAGSRSIDILAENRQYIGTFVALMDGVVGADDSETVANAKQALIDAYPDYLGVSLLDTVVPGYLKCIGKIAP